MSDEQATPPVKAGQNKVSAVNRTKLAVYMNGIKGILEGKTVTEGMALCEGALNFVVPDTAYKAACEALGIKPKMRKFGNGAMSPKGYRKLRALAGFVKDLYIKYGVEVPPGLIAIQRGESIEEPKE